MRAVSAHWVMCAGVVLAMGGCLVSFEDYPVAEPGDTGGTSGSGGVDAAAGTSGSAGIGNGGAGGAAGGTAGVAGSAGVSNGGASGGGSGGVSGGGSGGVSGGGTGGGGVDCSQYIYGLVGADCRAHASFQAVSVAACAQANEPGAVIVGCDIECLSQGGSACQPGMSVGSVTLSELCALNTEQPGCQPFCSNTANYDIAVSAACDAAGKCASVGENCGNYRCDQATAMCKDACKDSFDCVSTLQCVSTQCVP